MGLPQRMNTDTQKQGQFSVNFIALIFWKSTPLLNVRKIGGDISSLKVLCLREAKIQSRDLPSSHAHYQMFIEIC